MKITLVKENQSSGSVVYSVEVNGKFLSGTCSCNEEEAINIFENVIKNNGKFPNKTILLTHTISDDEQQENKTD